MRKIPRWLRIVLIVIVLFIVAGLVAPFFLDVDRYRGTIIAAIEKETGRTAEIGHIRAKLIPTVGFVIENFKLSNPPNFTEGNLLEVEAIRGSLAWGPLFRREFQLSAIELVNPKIVLLEDARGRTNYDFGDWEKKAETPVATEEGTFRIADIDSIAVTGVDVTVAQVAGRRVVPVVQASNISAELGNVALDRKRVKQWEADAGLSGVQVKLAAFRVPLEFASGSFTLRNGAIDSDFALALGNALDAKGTLKVPDVEKAVAEFDVSTSLLDLTQLAAAAASDATPPPSARPVRSELLAKGKVRAQRIRFAPYEATGASADVRVFTDRMEVSPASMQFYGGTIGATARVDMRQQPSRLSANIDVKQLNVEQLTAASGAQQKVTGTGEITMQVAGALGNNLLSSLTGSGNLAVRNGTLPGFDLGNMKTLAKVQNILTFGAGSAEKFAGATPFNSITTDLSLRGGRAHSQRFHLDSPSGTIDMRGSMGLVDQTLDYDGNAVLMGGEAGTGGDNPIGAITGILGQVTKQTVGRISVPFAVRGTLENPKIQPGRGIPTFSATPQSAQTEEEEKKKKGLFDIFRKP